MFRAVRPAPAARGPSRVRRSGSASESAWASVRAAGCEEWNGLRLDNAEIVIRRVPTIRLLTKCGLAAPNRLTP